MWRQKPEPLRPSDPNSPPPKGAEIELVRQEIGWRWGKWITKEQNEHMKFGWRVTQYVAIAFFYALIAAVLIFEGLR
jgi:hypothetical protein